LNRPVILCHIPEMHKEVVSQHHGLATISVELISTFQHQTCLKMCLQTGDMNPFGNIEQKRL